MLGFILKNYPSGSFIEITTSCGVYAGLIEFINDKYIVLRQEDGKICGISGNDIFTFKADIPEKISLGKTKWKTGESLGDGTDFADKASLMSDEEMPVAEQKMDAGTVDSVIESQKKMYETADDTNGITSGRIAPKVVGHIDLDKLQQIDPKLSGRNYFSRPEDTESKSEILVPKNSNEEDGEVEYNGEKTSQQPYIPAKGRVTYFNYEHRYGFIHDFATEADLYFKMYQIAEPMLLDRIRKGTYVVYTIDHNAQGPTANCLHLPHPVNTLFIIAENCLDSYKYYFAQEILEHILEVYPDNKDALEMLEETRQPEKYSKSETVHSTISVTQFNPSLIYSQAKRAYLKKEYDEAEKLYQQALEDKERPESCVKDLLTLYVSRFKQTEDIEEREQLHSKAARFLEANRNQLPDNLTNTQFLALNYYLPMSEYDKFITLVDDIISAPQIANAVSRRVFYLWQKAIALNKMGKKDEALALIDETLELSPNNRQLLNLKNVIQNPSKRVEQDMEFTAENCKEINTLQGNVNKDAVLP